MCMLAALFPRGAKRHCLPNERRFTLKTEPAGSPRCSFVDEERGDQHTQQESVGLRQFESQLSSASLHAGLPACWDQADSAMAATYENQ